MNSLWKDVDWNKSTSEIASELGCTTQKVSYARAKFAPETLHIRKTKYSWATVDWNRSTSKIAAELGCGCTTVTKAREKYAPETMYTPRKGAQRKYAWDTVDWGKANSEIAMYLGCNYKYVSRMRKIIGHRRTQKYKANGILYVRVHDKTQVALLAEAERLGKTVSYVINKAIIFWLAQKGTQEA